MKNQYILIDCLLIILFGAVVYGLFLGSYHLITPDEGRYPEIAREMVTSHNWITPHLNGIAFLDKPVLYYWCEALFIQFFGVSEWSIRLLPVAIGVLGGIMNYLAGNSLYNRRTGWLSALILMSGVLYFMSSHYADMDLMVAVLVSASLWLFIMAMQLPKTLQRDIFLWLAYIFAGFAFLTKGLMGIVFPAMVIGLWVIIANQWKMIPRMRLISGLILFCIVVFPWFYFVQQANPEFLNYFFVVQQFSRYLTNSFNMQQPIYFYVPVLLAGLLPWTIFLFQAIIDKIKHIRSNWKASSLSIYLLLWPLAIFIFFSIPSSKIIGYLLPVFPPLALLIAAYLSKHWTRLPDSLSMRISTIVYLTIVFIISVTLVVTTFMPSLTSHASIAYVITMAFFMLVGGVLSVAFAFQKKSMRYILASIIISSVLTWVTSVAAFHTFKLNNVKPLAILITQKMQPNDHIVTFQKYYQDLPVYVHKRIQVVANWNNTQAIMQEDNWKRELAEDILYKKQHAPWLIDQKTLAQEWKDPQHRVFVLTSKRHLKTLYQLVGQPIFELGRYDKAILLSNRKLP